MRSVPDLGAELAQRRRLGQPVRLQHRARGRPLAGAGARRAVRDAEEDEQTRRAQRLERLGRLRCSTRALGAGLAREIERLRDFTPREPRSTSTAPRSSGRILEQLLEEAPEAATA